MGIVLAELLGKVYTYRISDQADYDLFRLDGMKDMTKFLEDFLKQGAHLHVFVSLYNYFLEPCTCFEKNEEAASGNVDSEKSRLGSVERKNVELQPVF